MLPFFWLPEETLALRVRRDHVHVRRVGEAGTSSRPRRATWCITGSSSSSSVELGERYNIREIAYDRWNATHDGADAGGRRLHHDSLRAGLQGHVAADQGTDAAGAGAAGSAHGGHPVLRWNMDNAFVRTDPAGNLKIDKEKSTEKVDGAVALVMALDRAMKNQRQRRLRV